MSCEKCQKSNENDYVSYFSEIKVGVNILENINDIFLIVSFSKRLIYYVSGTEVIIFTENF